VGTEERLLLPCGCVGNCTILAVDRFDEWYFELYTRVGARASLWYRLKKAWAILLNRDHYLDALILSDEEIQKLRDFIDSKK